MIELFINPDEGAGDLHIKRNHQKTKWENLSTHEKNKIINCLNFWATVLKKDKINIGYG